MDPSRRCPSYRYKHFECLPSTYWTAIDIDFETKITEVPVNSLVDLCCEKLISDVCIFRNVINRLPAFLYSLILEKAIEEGRVLSIVLLIKYFPRDTLVFPVRAKTRNWSVLFTTERDIEALPSLEVATTVIQTFFNTISEERNFVLRTLDMNDPPIEISYLSNCLKRFHQMEDLPQQKYTLKIGLKVRHVENFETIAYAKGDNLLNTYFELIVTGLHICPGFYPAKTLHETLNLLKDNELLHFSIDFCKEKYNSVYPELKRFTYLKTLSFTYVEGYDSNVLEDFADALDNLHHLTQISFRGSHLTGILKKLLSHNCTKEYSSVENITIKNLNCCLIHRGKLKYLDISACRLTDEDLECLREFSVTKNLKYLNLGCNTFDIAKLLHMLDVIRSFIVVLDVEACFYSTTGLRHLLAKLEFMPNIKCINIRNLPITVEDFNFLSAILEKTPELSQIILSRPSDADFSFLVEYAKHMFYENSIDILF